MKIGIAGYSHVKPNYEAALLYGIQLLSANAKVPADALHASLLTPLKTSAEIACSLSPNDTRDWDALVLPGGGDLDTSYLPDNPPRHPECEEADLFLDKNQMEIIDLFVQQKKPILGICRGMQLLNVYFGGSLCQHLPTASSHRYIEKDQLHLSDAVPGSFLHQLYGSHFVINSAHHQGVIEGVTPLGKDLAVIQRSPDGLVEGFLHKELPVIGLQWHPERLSGDFHKPEAVDGSLVFQYFLKLADQYL